MTIQVESYRKETTLPSPDEGMAAVEARKARLEKAGFHSLIAAKTEFDKLGSAELLYGELKGDELALWKEYLPTRHSVGRYTYDDIPEEALSHIMAAQQLQLFDAIEIWTPEGSSGRDQARMWWRSQGAQLKRLVENLSDPMALGVMEVDGRKHYFPIARWGESLLSLTQIKRSVRMERMKVWSLTLLPIVVIAALVGGAAIVGFALTWAAIGAWAILAWVVGTAAVAVAYIFMADLYAIVVNR